MTKFECGVKHKERSTRVLGLAFVVLFLTSTSSQAQFESAACGEANSIGNGSPETSLELRATQACNLLLFSDNLDYKINRAPWENTTILNGNADQQQRQPVTMQVLDPQGDGPYKILLRSFTLNNVALDPGGQGLEYDPPGAIGLTLIDASVTLKPKPILRADQSLTLSAPSGSSGSSVITEFAGNQDAPTLLDVDSGASLQVLDSGQLGTGIPDSSRLNFKADNLAQVDGTLRVTRTHLIFNTGDSNVFEVTGSLLVDGGAFTTFETGNLKIDGGSVTTAGSTTSLIADNLVLKDADMNLGDNTQATTSVLGIQGTSTLTVGQTPGTTTTLQAQGVFPESAGASLVIDGVGTIDSELLQMGALAPGASINIGGEVDFNLNGTERSTLTEGSLTVGTDAALNINSSLGSSIPITNNGAIRVSGAIRPSGSWSGSGVVDIRSGGILGPLGINESTSLTSTPDILMADGSTFEVVIDPTAGSSQQLVANGVFGLGPGSGTTLSLDLFNDRLLPAGTEFTLVDYTGPLTGQFAGLSEGDSIPLGTNVYRLSYVGGDGTAITLTVTGDTPLPTTTPTAVPVMPLWLLGLMAVGIAGVASSRFTRARRG